MRKVVFISGVHGAGKGTMSRVLASCLGVRTFSSSNLIKENSAYVEHSKFVANVDKNQLALIHGLQKINDDKLLLDGHFCLLNSKKEIVDLKFEIFDAIAPSVIINVVCDVMEIQRRIYKRDGLDLDSDTLHLLQEKETQRAKMFCRERGVSYIEYDSGDSIKAIVGLIRSM
ncbi:ATP-binding protein [Vibrio scophthalmi]|nr:ATP-binding protein [Vibrio scophthalmi]